MSDKYTCPDCHGIVGGTKRQGLEAARDVHAATCPGLRRVKT